MSSEQPNLSAESRTPLNPQDDPLQPLLDKLGITDWDILIAGDGSGNSWDAACGWCAILIDRHTRGRRVSYGAVNQGSINFAETLPYLQLLTWFDQHHGKTRLESKMVLTVHIVTDSQVVANWGTAAMSAGTKTPRKQGPFWAAMRYLRSIGYVCHFHWAPRQTTQMNWAADLVAGLARAAMLNLPNVPAANDVTIGQRAAQALSELQFQSPDGDPVDVYSLDSRCPE